MRVRLCSPFIGTDGRARFFVAAWPPGRAWPLRGRRHAPLVCNGSTAGDEGVFSWEPLFSLLKGAPLSGRVRANAAGERTRDGDAHQERRHQGRGHTASKRTRRSCARSDTKGTTPTGEPKGQTLSAVCSRTRSRHRNHATHRKRGWETRAG